MDKKQHYLKEAQKRRAKRTRRLIFDRLMALAAIMGLILALAYFTQNREYNKNMCAMYGYQEDCKTPLKKVLDK